MKKNKTIYDHEGNEFANLDEMCDSWGISTCTYCKRKTKGWSLKKILKTKDKIYDLKSDQKSMKDKKINRRDDQCPESLKAILKNISVYDFFKAIDNTDINNYG